MHKLWNELDELDKFVDEFDELNNRKDDSMSWIS